MMITAVYNRSSPCCGELRRVSRSGDDGVVSEGGVDVDVEAVENSFVVCVSFAADMARKRARMIEKTVFSVTSGCQVGQNDSIRLIQSS